MNALNGIIKNIIPWSVCNKAFWNTLCLNKFSCWGEGISKLPFSKRSWSGVHIQAKELFVIETVSEYMKYRQPTCWDYLHLRKEALPNISSFITYLPFCSRYNSVLSLSIANCFHPIIFPFPGVTNITNCFHQNRCDGLKYWWNMSVTANSSNHQILMHRHL